MTKPQPLNADDLITTLLASQTCVLQADGYVTFDEMRVETKLSSYKLRELIRQFAKDGKLEARRVSRHNVLGELCLSVGYRLQR